MLAALLREKMTKENASARAAAKLIGVSHTTILKTLDGQIVDMRTLEKFSAWLNVKPTDLLNSMIGSSSSLSNEIAVVLSSSPRLAKAFGDVMRAVADRKVDPRLLDDIAAYAVYRLDFALHPGDK